jgi:hypothetical protein
MVEKISNGLTLFSVNELRIIILRTNPLFCTWYLIDEGKMRTACYLINNEICVLTISLIDIDPMFYSRMQNYTTRIHIYVILPLCF